MSAEEFSSFARCYSDKLNKSKVKILHRRISWSVIDRDRIEKICIKLVDKINVYFKGRGLSAGATVSVRKEGENVDEINVYFGLAQVNTERVYRKFTKQGIIETRRKDIQGGCTMSLVQQSDGIVGVIISKYTMVSDNKSIAENDIVVMVKDPRYITEKDINWLFSRFVFIAADSNIYFSGARSFFHRWVLTKKYGSSIGDNLNSFFAIFNKLSGVFVAVIAGLILFFLTK